MYKKWVNQMNKKLRLKLTIQSVISMVAFTLDIYGCFNFGLPPAILSVSIGVFDIATLLWLWKNDD